jgi:hypothetical protein
VQLKAALKTWALGYVPTVLCIYAFALLLASGVLADWRPSLLGVFLAQTYGPLVAGSNAISVLACCAMILYLWRVTKSFRMAVLLGFATMGIHEFIFAGFEVVTLGRNMNMGPLDVVVEAAFIAGAVYYANRTERKILVLIPVLIIGYWLAFYAIDIGNWGRLVSYPAGQTVFNNVQVMYDQILTVFAWFLAVLPWALLRRPQK